MLTPELEEILVLRGRIPNMAIEMLFLKEFQVRMFY
jgi:hypothetical protein